MKIFEIKIKDNVVVEEEGREEEYRHASLRLVNFLVDMFKESGEINYTHDDLYSIQDYYNATHGTCYWNFSEADFEEIKDHHCDEDMVAKITINGVTRYYEEL